MRAYKLKKMKRVHSLHFTPDGARLLAVGGAEVRMVDAAVWLDLATGANGGRVERFAACAAVDPRLTRLAVGGSDNFARSPRSVKAVEWTALTGEAAWQTFPAPAGQKPPVFREVSGLAFDPTGERLAIVHTRPPKRGASPNESRETISVVRLDRPEDRADLPGGNFGVIAFSADGTRVSATGGINGHPRVAVYDLAERREVFAFAPPATVTRCAEFLPDGRVVVANGRYVYVLPAAGGEPQFTLDGHPKQVNAVALTPDGRRLLTASHDGSIRTWNVNTGEPGPAFDWKLGAVTALAFAPDGLTCAAVGLNGNVVVWDVDV